MPKNKNPNDPPKKRGQPSDFKGSRLQFLTENVPKYIEASKKLNGTGKTGKKKNGTCEFYDKFFFEYWRKFPWRIPIEQEPPPEPEEPPKDAEDAFKALDLDLTEEEAAKKSRVQRETKEVR
jgi:hypothetical protein